MEADSSIKLEGLIQPLLYKPIRPILPVAILVGLFLFTGQNTLGGTITGTVFRRVEQVSFPMIDRYAGHQDLTSEIQAQHSTQDIHRAVVYLTADQPMDFTPLVENPQMDQINKTFQPWLLPVPVGTTVDFPNRDLVFHNVFSYSRTKKFDLGRYRQGKFKSVTFDRPGLVKIFCEIHKQMRAYILVLETSHYTTTDETGRYALNDVPAGEYTLHVWQENLPEFRVEIVVSENDSTVLDVR